MRDRVLQAIARAVAEVNRQQPPDLRVDFAEEAVLVGPGAGFDSVGLVTLVVAVEDEVERELGHRVSLTDEVVMARWDRIFASVGALADHLVTTLAGAIDDR